MASLATETNSNNVNLQRNQQPAAVEATTECEKKNVSWIHTSTVWFCFVLLLLLSSSNKRICSFEKVVFLCFIFVFPVAIPHVCRCFDVLSAGYFNVLYIFEWRSKSSDCCWNERRYIWHENKNLQNKIFIWCEDLLVYSVIVCDHLFSSVQSQKWWQWRCTIRRQNTGAGRYHNLHTANNNRIYTMHPRWFHIHSGCVIRIPLTFFFFFNEWMWVLIVRCNVFRRTVQSTLRSVKTVVRFN